MNNSNKPATSINIEVPSAEVIAEKRTLIPLSFSLIVILFFFGFVDFKCNGTTAATVTGFNLVTGTHLKTPGSDMFNALDEGFGQGNRRNRSENSGDKVPPSFWAILAFAAAIGGSYVFWKKMPKESFYGTLLGAIGFASLIFLMIAVNSSVKKQAGGMVDVDAHFKFPYWLSVLAFIVAGGISYLRFKLKKDAPPASRPAPETVNQLNVFVTSSVENDQPGNKD